jgi:ferredoxin
MRIVVDLNRCLGYAQCAFLDPDTFKLTGDEALTYEPNPDDENRTHVLRAAAACPVRAIAIDDTDSARQTAK